MGLEEAGCQPWFPTRPQEALAETRRHKSLPGSPGKVSRGHFVLWDSGRPYACTSKDGDQKYKLTQNNYRVLHLCINSMQDQNAPGEMGEMKAKIHFPPNFSGPCCSSLLAGLQHVPLRGWGAHAQPGVQGRGSGQLTVELSSHHKALEWKRKITSQCLSSPWVSAFISSSLSLTPSLSADGNAIVLQRLRRLEGRRFKQITKYHLALSMPQLVWVSVFYIVIVFKLCFAIFPKLTGESTNWKTNKSGGEGSNLFLQIYVSYNFNCW